MPAVPSSQPARAPSALQGARPRVVFLAGLGRSGTTLIERVLGELPGVCSAGELVHLWQRGVLDDELCGCGEPFSRCAFWQAVGTAAFGGWNTELAERMIRLRSRVDRSRYIPLLAVPRLLGDRRADLREYVGVFERLYRAIAQVAGTEVVVDSSKHPSLAFCLRTSDVDLRVVHVVRDIRGVAYSWSKTIRRPESGEADLMPRFSPSRSAALWMGHNVSLWFLSRLGTPTRFLRYEDFVGEPRTVVANLGDFASVPSGDRSLPFVDARSVELHPAHTVAGNPMRFTTGRLDLRRDDAWREKLPRGRRLAVSLLTLPLLAGYGYLRRPSEGAPR